MAKYWFQVSAIPYTDILQRRQLVRFECYTKYPIKNVVSIFIVPRTERDIIQLVSKQVNICCIITDAREVFRSGRRGKQIRDLL